MYIRMVSSSVCIVMLVRKHVRGDPAVMGTNVLMLKLTHAGK